MNIILKKATKDDYKFIKPLYISAFPAEERPPFFILKGKAKKGKGDIIAVYDGHIFVGFASLICYLDMAYLFFLAVCEDKRGRGYGSVILDELKKKYDGKRLFLAREMLDENSENYGERVKRHSFYIKNGFIDLPIKIKESTVVYDVMGIGGSIGAKEYDELISSWSGKLLKRIIDMRIIE